jgi:hypothetical protein
MRTDCSRIIVDFRARAAQGGRAMSLSKTQAERTGSAMVPAGNAAEEKMTKRKLTARKGGASKTWNVCYAVGNIGRNVGDADNPHRRGKAIAIARDIAAVAGWHVWVEHATTGVRIWDSQPIDGRKALR